MLALDHNSKPTQNKIVVSISKGIGTGLVEHIEPKGTEKHVKELTINLRMKPTMIFAKMEELSRLRKVRKWLGLSFHGEAKKVSKNQSNY